MAAPVSHDLTNSNTGLRLNDVIYSVYAPIINPPQSPNNEQSHASTGFLFNEFYDNPIKSSGKAITAQRYKTGVKRTVEIINYHLRVVSILSISSTFMILVAKNEVMRDTIIPIALISNG